MFASFLKMTYTKTHLKMHTTAGPSTHSYNRGNDQIYMWQLSALWSILTRDYSVLQWSEFTFKGVLCLMLWSICVYSSIVHILTSPMARLSSDLPAIPFSDTKKALRNCPNLEPRLYSFLINKASGCCLVEGRLFGSVSVIQFLTLDPNFSQLLTSLCYTLRLGSLAEKKISRRACMQFEYKMQMCWANNGFFSGTREFTPEKALNILGLVVLWLSCKDNLPCLP